jgi:anti-anti-sigma factor
MHLTIERRVKGDVDAGDQPVDLVVSGRLDAESGAELEHAVAEELHRGTHVIRLDFVDVSFLSSAGIRNLFNVHRAAKSAGGSCLIAAASEPVTRVLELTKLAPILMEQAAGRLAAVVPPTGAAAAAAAPADDTRSGRILFSGIVPPGSGRLRGVLAVPSGSVGGGAAAEPVRVPRHACGLGIAAIADDIAWAAIAGEMVAACGAVFHRPPQPFAAIDYLLGTENLVPVVRLASGLVWEGVPRGRAAFEPADDEPAVRFDELAEGVLELADAECVAMVLVGEVHGLVGAELIRPLAEATPEDHPGAGTAAVATRWLSFSREPVHARHTALVVGVATRGVPAGPLAGFVRPLGDGSTHGHAHAVVFPLRPLKRGAGDLTAAVDDLAASEPVAVMHLLGDPQPVLGSGQSEFVRGSCWFAPLAIDGGGKA